MLNWNAESLSEHLPIANGDYRFAVIKATEAISQSGNPKIELQLQADIGRANPITVYDRLVITERCLWRLKQFCGALVPPVDFSAGQLEATSLVGRTGMAHLVQGDKRADGRQFMEVGRYVTSNNNPDATTIEDASNATEPSQKVAVASTQDSTTEQADGTKQANEPPF